MDVFWRGEGLDKHFGTDGLFPWPCTFLKGIVSAIAC